MKSIFDATIREEVINRIDSLEGTSQAKWGKMNVAQMVRHCSLCEEYYFGNIQVNRSLLGRIIGRTAIKGILKDEQSTLGKNAPTSPLFKISENIDNLENEKQKWKTLIERYSTYNKDEFIHWFFGKITMEQLG